MSKTSITIILVVIFAWLIFVTYMIFNLVIPGERWKCSAVNCTKMLTGIEWANQNCFVAGNQTLCKLVINNQNQLIPIEYLNLSAIQQCIEFRCIEEIKIRNVDYVINIT
ncbi:MAG: hypothetical protein QXD48_02520 [Candidatus Aenigmatarchaeota archaeon]